MPDGQQIFLSCVSGDFGPTRTAIAGDLRRADLTIRDQDYFRHRGGSILQMLDQYIADCDSVVQIIGPGAGGAPSAAEVQDLRQRHPDLLDGHPLNKIKDRLQPILSELTYTQG